MFSAGRARLSTLVQSCGRVALQPSKSSSLTRPLFVPSGVARRGLSSAAATPTNTTTSGFARFTTDPKFIRNAKISKFFKYALVGAFLPTGFVIGQKIVENASSIPDMLSVSYWKKKYFLNVPEDNLLPDIGPIPEGYAARPTLIIVTDDTVIHSFWDNTYGNRISKRPGLEYFLHELSQHYEIVLMTRQSALTAMQWMEALDPNGFSHFKLFSDSWREIDKDDTIVPLVDLSKMNRPLDRLLVIDSDSDHLENFRLNHVSIPKYKKADDSDRELLKLIPFLVALASSGTDRDLRDAIKDFEGTYIPAEYERRVRASSRREPARTDRPSARGGLLGGFGGRP